MRARWSPRLRLGRQITLYRTGASVGHGLLRWFISWPGRGRRTR